MRGIDSIKPYHDLVLVRRIDLNASQLIITPESAKKESLVARIVTAGPGLRDNEPQCESGEYWLVARFIGTVFDIDGVPHTMVKWADCQAKINFTKEVKAELDKL